MPKPRLPYLRHEKNRHGNWCWYFRKDNGPRIRITEPYGSPAFKAAYEAALSGAPAEQAATARTGSVAWLVEKYKLSGKFLSAATSTQYFRGNFLRQMVEKVGDKPFSKITKKVIQNSMEARSATPHHANNMLIAISQMFQWAVENDHIKVSPCEEVKPFPTKQSDGHHTWSVEEVEQYRAHHKVGTRARLALDLLLFTGLRRSDIIKIGKQHVREGLLTFRTRKTKAVVYIPIFPELRASIDATDTADLAFITAERGMPFSTPEAFGARFRIWVEEAGLDPECTAHGVRKAGATIAANAGASAQELMAMYGWSRISMAELYTKAADKTRLARAAAERIANSFSPHPTKGAAKNDK
ncbi:tyrosine-type recombinase/integrase [Mesorhizobium sp. M7A.F.Ca.CA.002.12.1.1]|uniref:tyrosine-type recombinase/integrase n=1 Tax=Mesorhizobium sp. M7A.F.Ca.CA.002.12.1.1 TaxID=2496735 RepID=UPI000FCBC366|nr:tyrosine-type recombinase/integrase [Mesorhizobium sp. M7A.F.Ca.CA.002.12.1.1]RUX60124.1 integrase [Mesorhizobium sp. M7A.F.Ca.CA.002.12.1.1]